ncbi:unnamed protein product, partial [Meganyctiphanes norvegica]
MKLKISGTLRQLYLQRREKIHSINTCDGKSISSISTSNNFQGNVQTYVPIENGPYISQYRSSYRRRTSQESCVQLEKKCIPLLRIPTTAAATTTTYHIAPINHLDINSNM